MKIRGLPEVIKLILYQRGISQSELGRELGVSQDWVSSVSLGKRDPGFARACAYLARLGWEVHISPKTENEDPVKRRDFVTAAASAMFVPSPKAGPYQDPGYVRTCSEQIRRGLAEFGGLPNVPSAMRHMKRVSPALHSRDRELQRAAADLVTQAAWTLYDARRLRDAEGAGRLALGFARRCQDPTRQGEAYSNLSCSSAYRGDGARAAMYARHGLDVADLGVAHRAYLTEKLARALALLPGQERKSRALLDQARAVGGLTEFQSAILAGDAGVVLYELREFDDAEASLAGAVRAFEQWSPIRQVLYLARRVQAALGKAEPSQAAELMHPLVRLTPLVTSARLDGYIREISTMSARWAGVPEMRDAREQLLGIAPSAN